MAQELHKHFKMGDHVKVIGGRYEGDTGLIVRVEDNMVVLFADLTMHEVSFIVQFQKISILPPWKVLCFAPPPLPPRKFQFIIFLHFLYKFSF